MATYPQFAIHPQVTRAPIRAEIGAVAGAGRLRDVPLPRPRRAVDRRDIDQRSLFRSGRAGPEVVTAARRVQIDQISRQIIGIANINAEEIGQLLVPRPDVETQKKMVGILEKYWHTYQ